MARIVRPVVQREDAIVQREARLAQIAAKTQAHNVGQIDLSVGPVDCGWLIEGSILALPLAFFSGGKAEAKAHELGRAMAGARYALRVEVQDRMRKVIGATRYSAGLAELPSAWPAPLKSRPHRRSQHPD
jgi:hypothetical protein